MQRLILNGKKRHDTQCSPLLENTVTDFEHFARELKDLHSECDSFLEQQVSKISLQEARISMSEGRDLRRLSYLGFIFVPLSLSSSFFSVNVSELNGTHTYPTLGLYCHKSSDTHIFHLSVTHAEVESSWAAVEFLPRRTTV